MNQKQNDLCPFCDNSPYRCGCVKIKRQETYIMGMMVDDGRPPPKTKIQSALDEHIGALTKEYVSGILENQQQQHKKDMENLKSDMKKQMEIALTEQKNKSADLSKKRWKLAETKTV